MTRMCLSAFQLLIAMYLPFCAAEVRPALTPSGVPLASLWKEPTDLQTRDLYYGPWGSEGAPDADAVHSLVHQKHDGSNPGMTVHDPRGRQWSVKQVSPDALASEAPVEVALSRVLSAVGYHQPPVYYLPAFTVADDWGRRVEAGGRFRLKDKTLKDRGEWSWQRNPFVGTKPYQGLLVILRMFNSSDLKNSNNTRYEHRAGDFVESWYVVRDLGSALGTTGRFAPRRGDPEAFERHRFISGVRDGFVQFNYHGWHQELFRNRITTEDVAWASALLSRLSDRQWNDAFRAGGFPPATANRFIRELRARIAEGRQLVATETRGGSTRGS